MFFSTSSIALALLAASQLVAGHGAIVKAVGDAGGAGSAIGSKQYFSSTSARFLTAIQLTQPPHVMEPRGTHSNRIPLASRVTTPMLAVRLSV
jgi:hypothetical protein